MRRLIRLPKGIPKSIKFDHNYGRQEVRLSEQGFPDNPSELLPRLEGPGWRLKFIMAMLEAEISIQIVRMRVKRNWSQNRLGDRCGEWPGNRISYLESCEYRSRPTLDTLAKVADALGVGLQVRLVPISQMMQDRAEIMDRDWLVKTWEEEIEMLKGLYPHSS